jgi:A/G-specific adenine glycosylase
LSDFARTLIRWQRSHGRNDLPWQGTRDPYAIWLAEIMLQQTQVATVVPYYQRFRTRFPDIASLAAADEDEVLRLWSGLGYYSRARNLHRAAQTVVAQHGGRFPRELAEIEALPGIGRSTAAAIAGFAFGARAAILDGNVKRVLARHFAVEGHPGERAVEQRLWALAESLLPAADIEPYIQGLMDLGATVCTARAPQCERCPVRAACAAFAQNRVGELPAPRPRRAVPHRRTAMLVLRRGDDVLLQKRPAVVLPRTRRRGRSSGGCPADLRLRGRGIRAARRAPARLYAFHARHRPRRRPREADRTACRAARRALGAARRGDRCRGARAGAEAAARARRGSRREQPAGAVRGPGARSRGELAAGRARRRSERCPLGLGPRRVQDNSDARGVAIPCDNPRRRGRSAGRCGRHRTFLRST